MRIKNFDDLIHFLERSNDVEKVRNLYPSTNCISENDLQAICYWRESMHNDKKFPSFQFLGDDKAAYIKTETSITWNLIDPLIALKPLGVESSQFEKDLLIGGLATAAITITHQLKQLDSIIYGKHLSGNKFAILNFLCDVDDYFNSLCAICGASGYYLNDASVYFLINEWLQSHMENFTQAYKKEHNRAFRRLSESHLLKLKDLFSSTKKYEEENELMVEAGLLDSNTRKPTKILNKNILAGIIKYYQRQNFFGNEYKLTNEFLIRVIKNTFGLVISKRVMDGTTEYDIYKAHGLESPNKKLQSV